MTWLRLNASIALLWAVLAAGAAHFGRPTEHMADMRPKISLENLFPKRFGDWAIDDRTPAQLISPDVQAQLDRIYNETLSRTYINQDGDRIMLSVAYGGDQADGTRAHRPEVCYPAQGFQVMSSEEGSLITPMHPVRVRRLVAQLGSRVEPISYWIVVGDRIALSGTEQKLAQLSYTVHGVIPDGMLVRVSNIDRNATASYALHQAFLAELTKAIPEAFRSRVIGSTGK